MYSMYQLQLLFITLETFVIAIVFLALVVVVAAYLSFVGTRLRRARLMRESARRFDSSRHPVTDPTDDQDGIEPRPKTRT